MMVSAAKWRRCRKNFINRTGNRHNLNLMKYTVFRKRKH